MNPFLPLVGSAAVLLAGPLSAATLAVAFGGNYVTNANGSQTLQEGGFTPGGDPLQISPAANYTGPVIHGRMQVFSGTSGNANYRILNNGDLDRIELKTSDAVNNTGFLILFRQENFLNGLNTGNVGFDSTSSLRLNNVIYANQTADSGRIVLRQGTTYYISERVYTALGDVTTPNLTTLSYFAYDPATTIDPNSPTTAVSIVSGGMIQNVTEVGFYFEAQNSANAIRIQDIAINMVAIPEPTAAALLALAAPLCLRRRRRR
ncbi:PEP-CTERM sorting domain-containing protein [Luteolibacter sp. SL250]|uniref:PEP-CTERM sorting domain-containing protein n=1 Tax=Luteolibacter sp. SL250 TaxID=2995170 RepID=UPI0022705E5C|nr:PEP-CTERM sorting domain-containing protein [Luteolibacter sp. SL250]WAC19895.1 PEP-CTERM sorting domain-containing protein [Luteolibacter sp. SL250]